MEQNWDRNIGLVMAGIQREKNRAGAILLALAGTTFSFALQCAPPSDHQLKTSAREKSAALMEAVSAGS